MWKLIQNSCKFLGYSRLLIDSRLAGGIIGKSANHRKWKYGLYFSRFSMIYNLTQLWKILVLFLSCYYLHLPGHSRSWTRSLNWSSCSKSFATAIVSPCSHRSSMDPISSIQSHHRASWANKARAWCISLVKTSISFIGISSSLALPTPIRITNPNFTSKAPTSTEPSIVLSPNY